MTLVSQAEFARQKKVSRKSVTRWKNEGRIIIVDDRVDVEATQAKLLRDSSHRAKGRRSAVTSAPITTAQVTEAVREPLDDYPASMSAMVYGGASDLAVILLRSGMPQAHVAALVDEWLTEARRGATELLEDDLAPPAGFASWVDHPAFQENWPNGTDWEGLTREAATPASAGEG